MALPRGGRPPRTRGEGLFGWRFCAEEIEGLPVAVRGGSTFCRLREGGRGRGSREGRRACPSGGVAAGEHGSACVRGPGKGGERQ